MADRMDLQQLVVALTALVVALTALVPVVIRLWERVSGLTRRFESFWAAHIIRGKAEAYQKGYVVETIPPDSPDSGDEFMPMAVVKKVHEFFAPVSANLVALRKAFPDDTEERMAERIERRFGPWLGRHICVPLGVSQFACIVMALAVANGIPPVDSPEVA